MIVLKYTPEYLDDLMVRMAHHSTAIDVNLICQIHAILCKDAIQGVPGEFKKVPNIILGADFTPVPPYIVPIALKEWLMNLDEHLRCAEDTHAIIEAICRRHIAFERIHPFSDGNGRVGRALMAYSSMQANLPPIVIPVDKRSEYINYLNTNNLSELTAFVLGLLTAEKERFNIINNMN